MTDPMTLNLTYEQAKEWIACGQLLTTEQAALKAGVAEVTISAWVRRKWLTPYARSRPRLYRREDVERCADERVANDMRRIARAGSLGL